MEDGDPCNRHLFYPMNAITPQKLGSLGAHTDKGEEQRADARRAPPKLQHGRWERTAKVLRKGQQGSGTIYRAGVDGVAGAGNIRARMRGWRSGCRGGAGAGAYR